MSLSSRAVKLTTFWVLTAICVGGAVLYVVAVGQRSTKPAAADTKAALRVDEPALPVAVSAPPVLPPEPASPDEASRPAPARFVALSMNAPESVGTIITASIHAVDKRSQTQVQCERVYFSRAKGICLSREIHLVSVQTVATILDADARPLFTVRQEGVPSRARMSADGRYAAFTTFVTGHSYGDAQLSTATVIVETSSGAILANLEQFTVTRNGKIMQAADFNYWGVTFARDSNVFFATLRTGGTNYLVRGDTAARTAAILYSGVECPSLSPDETRLAFKKLVSRGNWRLTVLDLSTFTETPLAEARSVDDQAEWLDNAHVLYAMPEDAPAMGVNILSVSADGSGSPELFARAAASPAIIR